MPPLQGRSPMPLSDTTAEFSTRYKAQVPPEPTPAALGNGAVHDDDPADPSPSGTKDEDVVDDGDAPEPARGDAAAAATSESGSTA